MGVTGICGIPCCTEGRGGFFDDAFQAALGGGHAGVAQVLQAAGASNASVDILVDSSNVN